MYGPTCRHRRANRGCPQASPKKKARSPVSAVKQGEDDICGQQQRPDEPEQPRTKNAHAHQKRDIFRRVEPHQSGLRAKRKTNRGGEGGGAVSRVWGSNGYVTYSSSIDGRAEAAAWTNRPCIPAYILPVYLPSRRALLSTPIYLGFSPDPGRRRRRSHPFTQREI